MLRRLIPILFAITPIFAGILPDAFLGLERGKVGAPPVPERAVVDEYGLLAAEQAVYAKGGETFTATAWRMKDTTGAAALYQLLRPADWKPMTPETVGEGKTGIERLGVETPSSLLTLIGNYVLRFDGKKPTPEQLQPLLNFLPQLEITPLPPVLGFLPTQNLAQASERYILGPASLARFVPKVPPSTAAFHLGAEAEFARYQTKNGELALALFYYPTPQMARQRLIEFQKIDGVMAKRSGALIGVVLDPPNLDEAERLLAQVNYRAAITWSEPRPGGQARAMGDMLISIFALCGVLLLFCLVAGVALGGMRVLARKIFGGSAADDPMILLHLQDR
jgi:hypothetical protein